MDLDQASAYAMATWQRLEEQVTDEVQRAVCGAFSLVAVSDGHLDRREVQRFRALVRRHFGLPRLDLERLERDFVDLSEALMSDPEAGRSRALAEIDHIRGNPDQCELVRTAARLALVADERITPEESRTLDEILEHLGISR
ncbi:TerB family tellurite resistance protein [Myxococcota bacterium]|nr:TerB family tellurite resistance protein [Myxococcota bacterium]